MISHLVEVSSIGPSPSSHVAPVHGSSPVAHVNHIATPMSWPGGTAPVRHPTTTPVKTTPVETSSESRGRKKASRGSAEPATRSRHCQTIRKEKCYFLLNTLKYLTLWRCCFMVSLKFFYTNTCI